MCLETNTAEHQSLCEHEPDNKRRDVDLLYWSLMKFVVGWLQYDTHAVLSYSCHTTVLLSTTSEQQFINTFINIKSEGDNTFNNELC